MLIMAEAPDVITHGAPDVITSGAPVAYAYMHRTQRCWVNHSHKQSRMLIMAEAPD
jgi:hypothetical protein